MIDRQTVEKIKDAANIVEVVSEFVTLRKSGANYKGLCPFHNEKTPSFYVSPSRGTCHCFGCGKGGTPVNFIMEHEQMTYPEALRWLAAKYHIEIQERELTDDEKREQSERESMFIVNDWAGKYFQHLLHHHPDGVAVGMQYFRSRGFRDDVIQTFQLGFDLPDRFALASTAREKGYREEFLVKTGLCYRNDRGELIDRFAGRVVFPWIGVSGKVVGFSARVLDSRTKGVNQKYVNSPESEIYHKDHELYGIYQAKRAIAKEDRVYMVEGQADVISMYQCGIENVVANSGTALSIHQVHMLHRFTNNITLLYDGDEAGIHAALRGTDMLLAEGMNLKVLLLPDGNDPDSFARSHTAADFRKYIEDNQTDFIEFKTKLLLNGVTDPAKRSEAIESIIRSISFVQNQILRDTYVHDCAHRIGLSEVTIINTINRFIRENKEQQGKETPGETPAAAPQPPVMADQPMTPMQQASKVEQMLVQIIIRQGERVIMTGVEGEDGKLYDLSVAQYIDYNLAEDGLRFRNELYNRILAEAVEHNDDEGFRAESYFVHHPDVEISRLASALSMDRYQLTRQKREEEAAPADEDARRLKEKTEMEALRRQTMHLILDFRKDYVKQHMNELQQAISASVNDPDRMMKLMAEFRDMQQIYIKLAKMLGSDIVI